MPKQLIFLLDGTWNSREDETITNIAKMSFEAAEFHRNNPQIAESQFIYYDAGVGSGADAVASNGNDLLSKLRNLIAKSHDRMWGGATGKGIDLNIKQAYLALSNQYEEGDEIYLFGFSRGAFTARSLAGMIYKVGLLKKINDQPITMEQVDRAFKIYSGRLYPSHPALNFFRTQEASRPEIKFLGVFDTVGALGVPNDAAPDARQFEFHDTKLSPIIRVARHALAIDDPRGDFKPTIWRATGNTDSKQCWFVGAHSDVGGSYKEHQLSDIAREWMINEARLAGLIMADAGLGANQDSRLNFNPNHNGKLHDPSYLLNYHSNYLRPIGIEPDEEIHQSVIERFNGIQ